MTTFQSGDVVPSTFNWGIVAASYFASLCGCSLTIEILHRRGTALRSWRSWLETFTCATVMGLVGIWCMHFIGNRAIILGDGQPQIQLVYHSGYTILSLVLPILGLVVAFSCAELTTKKTWLHWITHFGTGIFAGLSVVGMHYVANFGVSNYTLHYTPKYMAASFIIAVGDCMSVLVLFYSLRAAWISSWWKRLFCTATLAGGISAMHFVASTNSEYTLQHFNSDADIRSRNSQVIIAGVMCGTAAFTVFCFLMYTQWRSRMFKNRSQHLTVACAIFDPAGRVLVTTEGVLPARKVVRKYNHRTFDDEFDVAHPVFQWMYRVTFNWQGVGDLIPKMRSHINAQKGTSLIMEDSRPGSSQSSAIYDQETYTDYALLFEEKFCIVAAALAASMDWPLEKIGVLYDKIIETGVLQKDDRSSKRNTLNDTRYSMSTVSEASKTSLFGQGQAMFITRTVDQSDANRLLNAGFRFASIQQVGRNISHAMQIPLPTLEMHISGLKHYVDNLDSGNKPGTYLSFFAMVPKPHHKGFDVAVKKDKLDQLPDIQVAEGELEPWQIAIIDKLDGMAVKPALKVLNHRGSRGQLLSSEPPREQHFKDVLYSAVAALIHPLPESWVDKARFWSKQLVAHYSYGSQAPTYIYAFTVIGDMHASLDNTDLVRTPKSFFDARHRCYVGSPDHANLAQDVHQTFSPLFAKRHHKPNRMSIFSANLPAMPLKTVNTGRSSAKGGFRSSTTELEDEQSSTIELVDRHGTIATNSSSGSDRTRMGNNWGGILVNSETTVQSDDRIDSANGGVAVDMPMGMNTAVSTAEPEVTFANELFDITKARFLPAHLSML